MLTNNVGALATLMPVAVRMGRSEQSSPSALLMPMSFMSLLGGLVPLVGTSTNIIVNQVREDSFGKLFGMFDFAPVGLPLTLIGLVFVSFGWRMLRRDRRPRATLSEVQADLCHVTETHIPDNWPTEFATVADPKLDETAVERTTLNRGPANAERPLLMLPWNPGQSFFWNEKMQASVRCLRDFRCWRCAMRMTCPVKQRARRFARSRPSSRRSRRLSIAPRARWICSTVTGIKLLEISRKGGQVTEGLGEIWVQAGNLLVLQAGEGALAETLRNLGLLALAERTVTIGDRRRPCGPILVLATTLTLVAAKLLTLQSHSSPPQCSSL